MKYADTYSNPFDELPQEGIDPERTMFPSREDDVMHAILLPHIPFWKRAMDIVIALACIMTIFPFTYLAMVILITAVSRRDGPVLFKQDRVGRGGELFPCLKFRTMKPGKNALIHDTHIGFLINGNMPMIKLENHPNVIRFGKILRKTCIDELPQLFNVLRGDMSIVGPRPCLPYEREKYQRWHRQRFDVLPGMTGLWQVRGKNRLTFEKMIRLDITYARKMSLWLDIKIMLKTPFAILQQVQDALFK